jgi:hypothetical protein
MHRQVGFLAFGFACCLVLGCAPHGVPKPVTGITPEKISQEMGKLAFLAYVGDALTEGAEAKLAECMPKALAAQADNWKLIWGPVVYRFPIAHYDDNMMYVVHDKTDHSVLVIVIRGTDPPAIDDWLAEDFDVDDQVSWPAGAGQPKISKAISEGLHLLLRMAPATDPKSTLTDFLTTQAAAFPSGLRVYVTGHSLGGALSPTLALWLHDNQSTWDPQGKAVVSVYPLAGPTPGNSDFATYYQSALGTTTVRLWNPFDVVPLAWNHESMGKMEDLYEPLTRANPIERGLIDGLRFLVKDRDYTQITDQEYLSGAVYAGQPGERMDWGAEAGWQHHCGYECALGIRIDPSVQPECPSTRPKCDCKGVQDEAGGE